MNDPMLYELFTTRNNDGRLVVHTRSTPFNTDDPIFSPMMRVPPLQPRREIVEQVVPQMVPIENLNQNQRNVIRNILGNFGAPRGLPVMEFAIPLPDIGVGGVGNPFQEAQQVGANGPGNTAPLQRNPLDNPFDAFTCAIETIMEIYPNLGDGDNFRNITAEQNDTIMGILQEAHLPTSRRIRNLVLREIILRTRVKTTVNDDALDELTLLEYVQLEDELQKKIDKCAICLSEFEKSDTVRIMKCDHFYHQACIDTYLKNYNNKCPMCRDSV